MKITEKHIEALEATALIFKMDSRSPTAQEIHFKLCEIYEILKSHMEQEQKEAINWIYPPRVPNSAHNVVIVTLDGKVDVGFYKNGEWRTSHPSHIVEILKWAYTLTPDPNGK